MSNPYPDPVTPALPSSQSIGSSVGKIWNYLNLNGETSIVKLKTEIQCTATIIHLSLGWLLREDKIKFSIQKGHLFVRLR